MIASEEELPAAHQHERELWAGCATVREQTNPQQESAQGTL